MPRRLHVMGLRLFAGLLFAGWALSGGLYRVSNGQLYRTSDAELIEAVQTHNPNGLNRALARGAHPNVRVPKYLPQTPEQNENYLNFTGQMSVLMLAAKNGDAPIVLTLLNHGADPRARDDMDRDAALSMDSDSPEIAAALVAPGTPVDVCEKRFRQGWLFHAARRCQPEVANFLIRRGARLDVEHTEGKTPLAEAYRVPQLLTQRRAWDLKRYSYALTEISRIRRQERVVRILRNARAPR